MSEKFPGKILNWIGGKEVPATSGRTFDKFSPATGKVLCETARSSRRDIHGAVVVAKGMQPSWADTPPVQRGMILHEVVKAMERHQGEIADIVAIETGKSYKEAYGETSGAIACGLFYVGEGQRLYGRTTTRGVENK